MSIPVNPVCEHYGVAPANCFCTPPHMAKTLKEELYELRLREKWAREFEAEERANKEEQGK